MLVELNCIVHGPLLDLAEVAALALNVEVALHASRCGLIFEEDEGGHVRRAHELFTKRLNAVIDVPADELLGGTEGRHVAVVVGIAVGILPDQVLHECSVSTGAASGSSSVEEEPKQR